MCTHACQCHCHPPLIPCFTWHTALIERSHICYVHWACDKHEHTLSPDIHRSCNHSVHFNARPEFPCCNIHIGCVETKKDSPCCCPPCLKRAVLESFWLYGPLMWSWLVYSTSASGTDIFFRIGETRAESAPHFYGSRKTPSESFQTLRPSHPLTHIFANVAALEFDFNGTQNLGAMTLRPILRQYPERALSQRRNLIAECHHGKKILPHMQSNLWRLGDAWLCSQTAFNHCLQKFG